MQVTKKRKLTKELICAPMVGASELPFRLLTRRYGATMAYTPMLSAPRLRHDADYRQAHFAHSEANLVCHVSANTVDDFRGVAQLIQQQIIPACALDLNLGCPQRTAFVGHFGSYLLDDIPLIEQMIRAARRHCTVFCKIRLGDDGAHTRDWVRRLTTAGASAVAIHARPRASWERTGPGARDGPADLKVVQQLVTEFPRIFTNGNTITTQDVWDNLQLTNAAGIMSAEGLLDNPSLFSPTRVYWGWKSESKRLRYRTKLLTQDRARTRRKFRDLWVPHEQRLPEPPAPLALAYEYLDLALAFGNPVTTPQRCLWFHTRRILKHDLERYQLRAAVEATTSIHQLYTILDQIQQYHLDPAAFCYDQEQAKKEKDLLQQKQRQESHRRRYQERLQRKAKREGKPLHYYLLQGAAVPTQELVQQLRDLGRSEALEIWKQDHSQHCLAFHLETCDRAQTCAFLHVPAKGNAHDVEQGEEVCG